MRKIDVWITIFSIIAGVIAFFCGEILFAYTYQLIPDELVVGLYFTVIGIIIVSIICLCVYKISKLKSEIPSNNIFFKSLQILIALTIIISFICGAGFEFLYSLGSEKITATDNYIIAIDNSGSMEQSDPSFERFNALNELFTSIKSKQKMGVYVFSNESTNIIELQNIDKLKLKDYQNMLEPYKTSDGGTNLMGTLQDIMNYIEIEKVKGGSSVIVISDGECNIDNNILNKFIDKGIAIHTIGVQATYSSLQKISTATGGIYYDIGDVNGLRQTFTTIYNLKTNHILLGSREGSASTMTRYIIMRILFIFILALIIKVMELFILDISPLRKFIAVQCILFSIIAGVIAEFFMQHTNLNISFVRFLMVLFISLLFATYLKNKKNSSNYMTEEFDFSSINNKSSSKGINNTIEDKRKSLK